MDLKRNIVENTNDSAVVSKCSMTRKNYTSDPFLRHFVSDKELKRFRSPLINRFYYLRFKAIEYAFNRAVSLTQVVSIGCGFDTSSLRFPNFAFIEIDFPFVAKNKAKILIDNQLIASKEYYFIGNDFNCLNTNEPIVVLRTDNYCLIGADLRKHESLGQLFTSEGLLQRVTKETEICLFNECSLCYLKQDISDRLIRVFTNLYEEKCHFITYLGFEQLKPNQTNDGFSRVMLNHFQTIGSPLKTFLRREEIIRRFKLSLNFESVEVIDMKTFSDQYIDSEDKQRIDSLEQFDEFEEYDSVCSCYALTIARTRSHGPTIQSNAQSSEAYVEVKPQIRPIVSALEVSPLLSRFGHSSCLTNDNKIVIFGGFGCDLNENNAKNSRKSHKRLSNLVKIDTKSNEIINYSFCEQNNKMQRIHSRIVELRDDLFFISGGRLSPNTVADNKLIKLLSESFAFESQSITESTVLVPKVFRHLVIKQLNSNKIIQFGGKQVNINCDTSAEDSVYYKLDANTMKWEKHMKSNLYSGVHSHSGASLDPNVFVSNGGLDCYSNDFVSNDFHLIDERMPFVNSIKVEDFNHLYSHNIKVLNENNLLIIGGMSKTGANNTIKLFDLRTNRIINSFDIITETPLMLTNFSSELVVSNSWQQLWLIGGGGNCFSFGTHFNRLCALELFSIE